jgi:hypothetical protein
MSQRQIDLAPACAKEGDCICIFQGAKVPFIARKTEHAGKSRLVGEAFVESFMHGELEQCNIPEREIILV